MKTELLFSSFPFISGETVTLSQIQESDTHALVQLIGEDQSPAEFLRAAESAFASRMYIVLGIYAAQRPNELLGTLKISDFDSQAKSALVDFALTELDENRDTARDAVALAVKFLFETIGFSRLSAKAVDADPLWVYVLERCGFTREGLMRQAVYLPEKGLRDFSVYALLKSEYPMVAGGLLLARSEELSILRMTGGDYEQMAKWLSDDKVLKYYQGRDKPSTLDMVIEEFRPLVIGKDEVTPCIIRADGRPIGYIQFYPISQELEPMKLEEARAPFGIDLFLGEQDTRNRGIGPRVLRLISRYLFTEMKADVVVGDPQAWNQRSINAFARAGFSQEAVLPDHELHEGKLEANIIMHRRADE